MSQTIQLDHLTRIEGHAHLMVDRENGQIVSGQLQVVETPRFFEAMLQGRQHQDVATIVARICGVCSISHTLTSLMATEAAFAIEVPPQAQILRNLLSYGEIAQSHLLQLYFMAVPDYLGVASLFQLLDERQDLVARALRLKRVGNRICEVVGGRPVHPVTTCLGGFSAKPEAAELKTLRQELVAALPDLEATVELFAEFTYPRLSRPREAVSLNGSDHYPLREQTVSSSAVGNLPVAEFHEQIEEYLQPHSTAKMARTERGSYMVGAQARLRNGYKNLSPMAQKVAAALAIDRSCDNPYENIKTRLVEVVHCIEASLHAIDELLLSGMTRVRNGNISVRAGEAIAAIEAPRGLLFHRYAYDSHGILQKADCIIPTAQNLASIEIDLQTILVQQPGRLEEELKRDMEKLIRSYDPCLSCSTHLLKIDLA